jgi:hypothetical protein
VFGGCVLFAGECRVCESGVGLLGGCEFCRLYCVSGDSLGANCAAFM